MGYRVMLFVTSGRDPSTVHKTFGLSPAGESEEEPDSPVIETILPNGDHLLYINDEIFPEDDALLMNLSRGGSVLAFYADETSMHSIVALFQNGAEKWAVHHNAQITVDHLEVTGSPPKELKAIRKEKFDAQRRDDSPDYIFDIPVDLFVALGGMRYDQNIAPSKPDQWKILDRV